MATIHLPDGHSAELRDVGDLRRRDVKEALRVADAQGINLLEGLGLSGISAIQEGLLLRFIKSWSLTNGEGPLPVTIDSLQDLPLSYYRPLADAITPAMQQVLGEAQPPVDPTSAAASSTPPPTA